MPLISGLDLGKVADFSALACVEKSAAPNPKPKRKNQYTLRWLETWELGTKYASIIADVKTRFDSSLLRFTPLAVDFTGVGTAVVEQLQAAKVSARLNPVLITSGHSISRPEDNKERAWHVPKKELVSTLIVLLEAGLLRWASPSEKGALKLISRFEKELSDFRVKVTKSRNETFSGEGSQHDDLVLAVSLAVWLGEHTGTGDASKITVPEPGSKGGSMIEAAPAGVFADAAGGMGGSGGNDPRFFNGRP